jgi:hypothetical protein
VPPPAERARTLTARRGTAAVVAADLANRTVPTMHHVHHDGSTILMLPADHPLATQVDFRPPVSVAMEKSPLVAMSRSALVAS